MPDESNPSSAPCLEMAHVLFMDIVAYSQLPMNEQTRLIGKLQQIVRNTADFGRAQKRRQLLRLPTGDGMALVFFGDAEAPVRCALEVDRALREHGDLKLRMGIHTGPVQRVEDINANRNVAGGGINIAQRVMDCGDAGHILVSSAAAEILGHISAWRPLLHDLGEMEVKHGVRIHVCNLYSEEAGNPHLPKKVEAQRLAPSAATSEPELKRRAVTLVVGGVILTAVLVGGWLFYSRKAHALGPTDTIVLSDFENKTGDAVFDDTLRQGLSVQLGQSPFLSMISERKINQTLKLMGHPTGDRLTPDLTLEICQRIGSKAMLTGSIAGLGSQYVIGLKAVNCQNGDLLAQAQEQAAGKEGVLKALDAAAVSLRSKLGESLSTVQEYATPLADATTPSLEALKAYSTGLKALYSSGSAAGYFLRATEIDPQFAVAYAWLGRAYSDSEQHGPAREATTKAWQLRDRASEQERFFISFSYQRLVLKNLEKARQTLEVWARTYPRGMQAHSFLGGSTSTSLGKFEEAGEESQKALELDPDSAYDYMNLGLSYGFRNRLPDAEMTLRKAADRKLDIPEILAERFSLAFLKDDKPEMQRLAALAQEKYDAGEWIQDGMSDQEGSVLAYSGRLQEARAKSRRAVDIARQAGRHESASQHEAGVAVREALFGNAPEARRSAAIVLEFSDNQDAQYGAAFALALVGDSARSEKLADEMDRRSPEDTIVQFSYLPVLRAIIALNRGKPSKAIELLQAAAPYELGYLGASSIGFVGSLYPIYTRGEAYLAAKRGVEAAAEFQKILDHRGIVAADPIGVLAHLQSGRAFVLSGDKAKANTAYQDFLTLWKDADPDIPILKQAKAEYAKLQ